MGSEMCIRDRSQTSASSCSRVSTSPGTAASAARRSNSVGVSRISSPATEFDLLAALAAVPDDVLTREQLLADVWDWPAASGTRTVDSHVKALRAKIGADRVRTVHGVGYALEPELL